MHEELEHLRNLPPKIETKIEKVVEKVEVIPHDYEDLKHHLHEMEEELE